MNYLLCFTLGCLWALIGYKSFVFWWTHDYDYTTSDRITAVVGGLLGPISFGIGYLLHHTPKERKEIVLTPKREK